MEHKRIFIPILHRENIEPCALKEVCAGLEEEGVPYLLKQIKHEYQNDSFTPLQVKVVIEDDKMMVYHEKIVSGEPYITEKKGNERLLGKNAARLVKGLPLTFVEENERSFSD